MKFYISGTAKTEELAQKVADALKEHGHAHTYERAAHGDARGAGAGRMGVVSSHVARAILDCELFIALLPGDSTVHTEIGIAIAAESIRGGKTIVVYSASGAEFEFNQNSCEFYFHPVAERLSGPTEQLINYCKYAFEGV